MTRCQSSHTPVALVPRTYERVACTRNLSHRNVSPHSSAANGTFISRPAEDTFRKGPPSANGEPCATSVASIVASCQVDAVVPSIGSREGVLLVVNGAHRACWFCIGLLCKFRRRKDETEDNESLDGLKVRLYSGEVIAVTVERIN
jgi:hypothetical protein